MGLYLRGPGGLLGQSLVWVKLSGSIRYDLQVRSEILGIRHNLITSGGVRMCQIIRESEPFESA